MEYERLFLFPGEHITQDEKGNPVIEGWNHQVGFYTEEIDDRNCVETVEADGSGVIAKYSTTSKEEKLANIRSNIERWEAHNRMNIRNSVRLQREYQNKFDELPLKIAELEEQHAERKANWLIALGWNFIVYGYFFQITHMMGVW